ncbi:MAG: hypothetical protein ACE5E5_15250 [Phycisphaerae bacterium]
MAQERSLELPERVVTKIQKVLGISPESLPKHDLVSLIEELCDTALMFDQNAQGAGQTKDQQGMASATGRPTAPSTTPA